MYRFYRGLDGLRLLVRFVESVMIGPFPTKVGFAHDGKGFIMFLGYSTAIFEARNISGEETKFNGSVEIGEIFNVERMNS